MQIGLEAFTEADAPYDMAEIPLLAWWSAEATSFGAPSSRSTARSSAATAAGPSTSTGHRSASGDTGQTVARNPDEPPDEGPVESLGRAVSGVVTGPVQDRDEHDPAVPPRRR